MKAELTIELAERFAAQYWGQNVLCMNPGLEENLIVLGHHVDVLRYNTDAYLLLRPIDQLTSEESAEVARLAGYRSLEGTGLINEIQNNFALIELEVWDYLRSIGIAVPFMNHSVEDLVEAGWIKLQEP